MKPFESSQIDGLVHLLTEVSHLLLHFFQKGGYTSEIKPDHSPVTEADRASNSRISDYLQTNFPSIPIISEESMHPPFSVRSTWSECWMIDPLDGTREFMSGNNEFAIHLALISHGKPVIGLVALPASQCIYLGIKGEGAYCLLENGTKRLLDHSKEEARRSKSLRIVISRSHAGQEEEDYLNHLKDAGIDFEVSSMGSSVKQMFMAEGKADLYPKLSRCWEWDTAPGQLILAEAGGQTVNIETGIPLVYNKSVLYNPPFLMWGPNVTPLPWQMDQGN